MSFAYNIVYRLIQNLTPEINEVTLVNIASVVAIVKHPFVNIINDEPSVNV